MPDANSIPALMRECITFILLFTFVVRSSMDNLSVANKRLKTARDSFDRDYEAETIKLAIKEDILKKRSEDLSKKKLECAQANGNSAAAGDDLIEINAGGKIIAAKRSTLTLTKGTRLEALFRGRWDKKLQRDSNGRIFLDVNPICFEAIVDYLNEMAISSEDDPPSPPTVNDEYKYLLQQQLQLFEILANPIIEMPDSNILKGAGDVARLHDWLNDDNSGGNFKLLYRSSRDGLSARAFHSKCDNQGNTITVIETADGFVLGGYSNTPWTGMEGYCTANKAFLFVLSGSGIASPCKMKLKDANDDAHAVYHGSCYGPIFGVGHDLYVLGSSVYLYIGHTYESGPPLVGFNGSQKQITIKEMEVFGVSEILSGTTIDLINKKRSSPQIPKVNPVTRFSEDVNKAINAKQESLSQVESEILDLEVGFKDEHDFITVFASGDTKDIVNLNVSGTMMATNRSTLQILQDSVLSQQFDDSKWTAQGCNVPQVKGWTPADVYRWAHNIDDISAEVANVFVQNSVTGNELLALNIEGLKMLGIARAGTLCLLMKEIDRLEKASSDVVTLIEHSAYCFGKILDYLRLKRLHTQGLAAKPDLPTVDDSQKSRFVKLVKYYFPGDSAKLILGA